MTSNLIKIRGSKILQTINKYNRYSYILLEIFKILQIITKAQHE